MKQDITITLAFTFDNIQVTKEVVFDGATLKQKHGRETNLSFALDKMVQPAIVEFLKTYDTEYGS